MAPLQALPVGQPGLLLLHPPTLSPRLQTSPWFVPMQRLPHPSCASAAPGLRAYCKTFFGRQFNRDGPLQMAAEPDPPGDESGIRPKGERSRALFPAEMRHRLKCG
jgi:hypothetical protein